MKIKYLLIILVLVALAIYLNRAYAHIYSAINQAGLITPDTIGTYVVGNSNSPAKLTYVALGDSLTAGVGVSQYEQAYPYLLAQKIANNQAKVTLKNLGVSGFKTENLINSSLESTIAAKPDIITLLIGINDLHGNVAKKDFQKNYQQILQELAAKTTAKIYVIGLPQIGSNQLLWPPYNYYFRRQTKNFNEIIQQLTSQYKLTYVDLETPTTSLLKNDGLYYSTDLFHPGITGHELWAQIIYDDFNK
jgi:acyl-CoA thioesterase-1